MLRKETSKMNKFRIESDALLWSLVPHCIRKFKKFKQSIYKILNEQTSFIYCRYLCVNLAYRC
jgi:hypothetical protein